jgi:DHA2 family multidrug resistance protein
MVVIIPTFMEVLDTTIANVALRYIAGGLSVAETDAEWVITSYLAANALVLPISGWLAAHLGRRNYFLMSIAVFTLASGLCGMATSLDQMILFRVIQGLAGGGLQPSSQAVLLDSFPPEKQGSAMTLFGVAALIGPIVGPTLGGYLCDYYNWRWIFLINIPVGLLAVVAVYILVDDPDYLKSERSAMRGRPLNFDYIGLGVLSLTVSCWEVVLSKGQEWDWLGDPFYRVHLLALGFVGGLIFFVVHELRNPHPIIDLRVLKDRNLTVSCVILFFAFGLLYMASIALPVLLQTLFGYDAFHAGLVMSPAGFSSIAMMVFVGILLGKGTDARWLIAAGLVVLAIADYWMANLNLFISPWQIVWPRMLLTAGLGLIFAPISVAAYKYVPAHLRGAAVGLSSLLRNEGGSVGTSMSQTIQERREQFHLSRLNDGLSSINDNVRSFLSTTQSAFSRDTADPVRARQMAIQMLDNLRQDQALSLSYFDLFWISAAASLALVVLVFFMKRSVAEKGASPVAE